MTAGSPAPTWSRPWDIPRCVAYRPHLARTATTAVVVGTVLFAINHLDQVLRGQATTATWVATGLSFVVPFLVANTGLLIARHRSPAADTTAADTTAADTTATTTPAASAEPATIGWTVPADIPRCLRHRRHLTRTVLTALIVGTVYFLVNQMSTVLADHATTSVWVAGGTTYLVPFCVANLGLLVGTHQPALPPSPERRQETDQVPDIREVIQHRG